MKSPLAITTLLTFLAFAAVAQEEAAPPHPGEAIAQDCAACHVSATPTPENSDLNTCPRDAVDLTAEHDDTEAPDVFLLDKLSDIYVPVVFPHKFHAQMTEMGQGCVVCHHRNPPGPILSCDECHGGPSNPQNLKQPGLKGAYHRQCLSCHREWTHETDCVICHARKDPNKEYTPPPEDTDIMGMLHPNIETPDVKVYLAEELADTPYVTFHHKAHTEIYGLQCVDCHREESCSNCHDSIARPAHIRADPHEDCTQCHTPELEGDCAYCHTEAPLAPFNHAARTEFDLAVYHEKLVCRDCHESKARFAKLESSCSACHAPDWAPEEFDHARTGLTLDETHSGIDCTGCHTEGIGNPVACTFCHEDGRTTFEVNATELTG